MKKLILKIIISIPTSMLPLLIYFILNSVTDSEGIITIGYPILLFIQIVFVLINAFLIGAWIHKFRSKDDQLTG